MSILSQDVRPRLLTARESLSFCLNGSARQALSTMSAAEVHAALAKVCDALVAVDAQINRANIPTNVLK